VSDRYPTSAKLLAGIHEGDEPAIREFFLLYAPLLRDQARRMGVDGDERDDMVTTLLDDVVLHLMEQRLAPKDLARYLIAAFRNRARRRHRDSARRETRETAACSELGVGHQAVIAECISDYTLAVTNNGETHSGRSAISGLARCVSGQLAAEEMTMMIGIGRHMPLREIAAQIGISYGAARVRVHRLRERFRGVASSYVATLEPEQKKELSRFFRRAELELPPAPVHQSAQRVLREPGK